MRSIIASGIRSTVSGRPRAKIAPLEFSDEDRIVALFTVRFFALLVHAPIEPSSASYERCDEMRKKIEERLLDPEPRQCA